MHFSDFDSLIDFASKVCDVLEALHNYKDGKSWGLKVHKNENFFGFDFEICTFS